MIYLSIYFLSFLHFLCQESETEAKDEIEPRGERWEADPVAEEDAEAERKDLIYESKSQLNRSNEMTQRMWKMAKTQYRFHYHCHRRLCLICSSTEIPRQLRMRAKYEQVMKTGADFAAPLQKEEWGKARTVWRTGPLPPCPATTRLLTGPTAPSRLAHPTGEAPTSGDHLLDQPTYFCQTPGGLV